MQYTNPAYFTLCIILIFAFKAASEDAAIHQDNFETKVFFPGLVVLLKNIPIFYKSNIFWFLNGGKYEKERNGRIKNKSVT